MSEESPLSSVNTAEAAILLHVTLRVLVIVQYVGNSDILNRKEQMNESVCAKMHILIPPSVPLT